jgi:hypothetical protein
MHVAIAVGTMLLSAWTLGAPDEGSVDEQQPEMTIEEPGPSPMPSQGKAKTDDWGTKGMQRGIRPEGTQGPGGRSTLGGQQRGQTRSRPMQMMPAAPTDTTMPGGRGQPSQPTSSELGAGMYGTRTPMAPTAQRRSQQGYHPMSHGPEAQAGYASGAAQASNMALQTQQTMTQQAATATGAGSDKLFSGYHAPSGISPYMNLFRGGTALGTIDNYTTLVRPELEQRFMNQQVSRDLVGLERTNRAQQLRQQMLMQQQTRSLQGVGTPQYYMNYGGYYQQPGQAQPGQP